MEVVRNINELIDEEPPAWPALRQLLADSKVTVDSLPVDRDEGCRAMLQLQVSAKSVLGALFYNCGGLLIDDGWVRAYAGGTQPVSGGLPSLATVNEFPVAFDPAWRPAEGIIVGHDVIGGVFALSAEDMHITYFAPTQLEWMPLHMSHGTWLSWLLSGELGTFYDGLRWPGWRDDVAALSPSEGITIFPFPWTEEAQTDIAATTRKPAPLKQILDASRAFAQQAGLTDPGFLGNS